MTAIGSRTLLETLGSLGVGAFYMFYFWRVFKRDPGNRFIECGVITLAVFFSLVFFGQQDIPMWLFLAWVILVLLLCFTSLFFLVQRGVRALQRGRDTRDKRSGGANLDR